ncbi:MAG: hypothetical protein FJ288_16200 [Planctomycetes bacterium]|nr:hypothetical protein [Planctomycetota bacterium]
MCFDIAWENSWRHEANHDAAWVFFKVRAEGEKEWQHVRLVADKVLNPTGYSQETGGTRLDFVVPDGPDGFTGMFVRRAEYGVGKVAATKVTAIWDLAANKGMTKDPKVSVRAFGIEMVFVPEGPFFLGSGGTEPYHFYQYTDGTQHTQPYRVTSAGAIPTGQQAGKLWARRGAQPEDKGELPAAFPNGYAAFYCMKFHVLVCHYTDFLNMLDAPQAEIRYTDKVRYGQIGRSEKLPKYICGSSDSWRACVALSWADGATFAAWAGLRPMTELEYEKVTRGPMEPGWDTGDDLDHPSYWEVRNINGWRLPRERPVTVGNAKGRSFKGTHGQGRAALPADWPQEDAVGAGIRGGHGAAGRPSHRLLADGVAPERADYGWRGVRTAPKGIGN